MAGGRRCQRKPATSSSYSSSAWQWKPRGSRESDHERSLDSQKEGSCSSSPSVSSKKSPPQLVTPVQPPESLKSPPQMVTPVEPPKSLDSQVQMVTPVQAPKSQDSLVLRPQESLCSYLLATGKSSDGSQNGGARAPCFSASETEPVAGGDGRKLVSSSQQRKYHGSREYGHERSLDSQTEVSCSSSPSVSSKISPPQTVAPVQPPESLDLPPQIATPVEPPKSLDSQLQMVTPVQAPKSLDSLVQRVASIQLSKPLESRRTSSGSGAVGSDLGAAPFDICMGNSKGSFKLKPGLIDINRAKKRAEEVSNSAPVQHLRPGMVLLKNFLKPDDQVKIINRCRDLGVGPGGFYQPAYTEGGKLNLRMMCLGKNWDPDSSSYGDIRPFDAAQPPKIPDELTKYVKDAIEASHKFLKKKGKGATNPAVELPLMSPDICIVNFYTTSGKLGLHQDKDEEKSSIESGLPVVSFSFGDTAEFLYGDDRDEAKASKIKLEAGDVLIFGGKSRRIFHGVSSIVPKSAPLWMTDKANLRPGRLNLTFRQHKCATG